MQPGEPAKQQANATTLHREQSAKTARARAKATHGDKATAHSVLLLQLGDEANSACSSTSSALKAWRRAT